jgi:hypothetical protein
MDEEPVRYVLASESFGVFAARFQRPEMTERKYDARYPERLRLPDGVCGSILRTPGLGDT